MMVIWIAGGGYKNLGVWHKKIERDDKYFKEWDGKYFRLLGSKNISGVGHKTFLGLAGKFVFLGGG